MTCTDKTLADRIECLTQALINGNMSKEKVEVDTLESALVLTGMALTIRLLLEPREWETQSWEEQLPIGTLKIKDGQAKIITKKENE